MAVTAAPNFQLPWSSLDEDNKRFRRVLLILMVPFLIMAVAIPLIHVPEPEREELEKLPPQLARVVMEEKELPKPPPPPPPPEPEPEPEPEEMPEPEPEPEPEPKPEPPKPKPKPEAVERARDTAKKSGVLQFADDLAAMRDAVDVSDVQNSGNLTRSTGEAAQVDRSIVTSGAKAKSGGINTAELSRDTGGVALSGRESTGVESKMEEVSAAVAEERGSGDGKRSYRSQDGVRQKLDAAKSRVYSIYNRALRKNPTLQGKVEFKIVIDPDGSVANAEIVSSQLDDPDLERKLLAAIRLIDFGSEDVLQTTLNYSYDFLPF